MDALERLSDRIGNLRVQLREMEDRFNRLREEGTRRDGMAAALGIAARFADRQMSAAEVRDCIAAELGIT